MHRLLRRGWLTALLAALLAHGCASEVGEPGPEDPAGPVEPSDPPSVPPSPTGPLAGALLSLHNAARAAATPAPSPPLPPLTWSEAAARAAQAWADGCVWEHDPALDALQMGQNLYALGGTSPSVAATPDQVVGSWVGEAVNYHRDTNTCDSGKVCGHYTAVVWRSTTLVGCGRRACTGSSPFGERFPYWELWVCNYAPPGNWRGQRPY